MRHFEKQHYFLQKPTELWYFGFYEFTAFPDTKTLLSVFSDRKRQNFITIITQ